MTPEQKTFLGELRLGRRYTTLGPLVGLGMAVISGLIFIVIASSTYILGLKTIFALLLTGLALVFVLLMIAELLAGSGERGGIYNLVQETIGGPGAFLTGWSLLAGCAALGAALIQGASQSLIKLINIDPTYQWLSGTLLYLFIVILQILPTIPRSLRQRSFIRIIIPIFSIIILSTVSAINFKNYAAPTPEGPANFLRVAAWLISAYAAFETVLASRRQIQDPNHLIPRSFAWILITGFIFFSLAAFITTGLGFESSTKTLTDLILEKSFLSGWFILIISAAIQGIGANGVIQAALRQIHQFSRHGAFPLSIRKTYKRIPIPPALQLALAFLVIPFIYFVPSLQLIEISGGLFLITFILLNIAAIFSRYLEPDRRRILSLPFNPVIPVISIGLNFLLIQALSPQTLQFGSAWLLIGLGFYYLYSRSRQVAAMAGETIFGGGRRKEDKKKYRILVPLGQGQERRLLLSVGVSLTRQLNGELIPLQVIPVRDPLAIEQGRKLAKDRNELFQWSMRYAENAQVPVYPITRLARNIPDGIIDTALEESCDLVLLSWDRHPESPRKQLGAILDPVLRGLHCDIAVVSYRRDHDLSAITSDKPFFQPKKVLVPTAGGPHAPLATQIALLLTREHKSVVEAVYIASPGATPEDIEDGQERINQTITAMREQESKLQDSLLGKNEKIPIEGRVIQADEVVGGIVEASIDNDLVLIGASEENLIDQVLFGNIPERVAKESSAPVIMVKRFLGFRRFWLKTIFNTVFQALPKLAQPAQVQVFRQLNRDARPSIDYFILIGLSTLIATFGLLQNSTAVIIGAMLVAPLFTPLMATSLAIAQGNIRLLRNAIEATIKGIVLAIGLAIFVTAIIPNQTITPEIIGRTAPSLLDLGVALAAGIVGAYAIARKEVAAALPGVAIAAALVPPLGVVGIGLAIGNLGVAGGAALLVVTNLVAIALSGAITLIFLGFRPFRTEGTTWLRQGLTSAMILFILITIPLIAFGVDSLRTSQTTKIIQNELILATNQLPNIEITNPEEIKIQISDDKITITLPVYTNGDDIAADWLTETENNLTNLTEKATRLRLVLLTIIENPD